MAKLIFGCGYLGERVAKLWRVSDEVVHVVTRSAERAFAWQADGYLTHVADVADADSLCDLPAVDTVLFAVGLDRSSDHSIHQVYADGVRNVLAALSPKPRRFLYISTTGVYGPASGDWVDETTPPNPQRDGGKASLAAEQQLGRGDLILRLSGIYGPGRIPYLEKLRVGEPIAAPSEGWLNLIHVDDAAAIVLAAEVWAQSKPPSAGPHLFCVSDGQPVVRGDYYREVARLIGADPPRFMEPDADTPAAARARSDKRIRNEKLRRMLGFEFSYSSYREGLASILADC